MPFVEKTFEKTKECAGSFLCRYKIILLIFTVAIIGSIVGVIYFSDK